MLISQPVRLRFLFSSMSSFSLHEHSEEITGIKDRSFMGHVHSSWQPPPFGLTQRKNRLSTSLYFTARCYFYYNTFTHNTMSFSTSVLLHEGNQELRNLYLCSHNKYKSVPPHGAVWPLSTLWDVAPDFHGWTFVSVKHQTRTAMEYLLIYTFT